VDVVLVDGGSSDGTAERAKRRGIRVLENAPNRAEQMNTGAAATESELLLFLHGDTRLPDGYDALVRETLSEPSIAAGAFRLSIDAEGWPYRLIETVANWRSGLLALPYGDQTYFVRRETFERLGGFSKMPIMEDYDFVRRAARLGRIALVNGEVKTSARRWQALGTVKTTIINYLIVIGYNLGVHTERLAAWYGR
jgi:rSAM/selenodomain-associated transferase 2